MKTTAYKVTVGSCLITYYFQVECSDEKTVILQREVKANPRRDKYFHNLEDAKQYREECILNAQATGCPETTYLDSKAIDLLLCVKEGYFQDPKIMKSFVDNIVIESITIE